MRSKRSIVAIALVLWLSYVGSATASPVSTTVSKVEPDKGSASGGTSVTITGTNFTGATEVRFGSRAAASFTVNSSTSITAVSPPWGSGNAIAEVTVATPVATGTYSGGDSFIYEPVVTKIAPGSGPAAGGTSVTITGAAFQGLFENGAGEMPPFVSSVMFGSHEAASFKVESEDTIVAISPPGAGTADVTVTTLGGTSAKSSVDRFAYTTSSPTGPPSIEGESVSHITATDATLEAQINTEGLATTYTFYLQEAAPCEEAHPPCMIPDRAPVALPSGKLLGSFVGQVVSADLNSAGISLDPHEDYTYWVTATSAAGTTQGQVQRFIPPEDGVQPLNITTPSNGSNSGSGSQAPGLPASQNASSIGAPSNQGSAHASTTKHHVKRKHRMRHKHHGSKAARHKHHNANTHHPVQHDVGLPPMQRLWQ
jgi:IPT/TIG domain